MNSRNYLPRAAGRVLEEMSSHFKVVLVTGARQVGKSTLLMNCGKSRNYVSLDDPMVRELALSEPELFLERYSPPVIIDEIQYVPSLFQYIKLKVDKSDKKGQYWLTGSQHFSLMQNVSESLAGRVGIINLRPLSFSEVQCVTCSPFLPTNQYIIERRDAHKAIKQSQIFDIIWRGLYPDLVIDKTLSKDLYYSSYLQTYIEKDVKMLGNVGNERDFLKFLRVCAARTGSMLNYSDMAADIGVSVHILKKWMSILVASDIVYLLEPYYTNRLNRAIKTPKLYFVDTGLCSYLASWNSSSALENGAMSGEYFETFVVGEIIKSYKNAGITPNIYYYRDKDKKEIDLIIEKDSKLYPIEIKKTSLPKKDMLKNFSVLDSNLVAEGALICQVSQDIPLSSSILAIPVSYL